MKAFLAHSHVVCFKLPPVVTSCALLLAYAPAAFSVAGLRSLRALQALLAPTHETSVL